MGRLVYDSRLDVDFEDRLLGHLQVVIGTKLGRGESFYLSWKDLPAVGSGRTSIWLHPASALRFRYASADRVVLNQAWVRRWIADSYAPGGLRLTDEPEPEGDRPTRTVTPASSPRAPRL
ncbi:MULTISPECIES: ATP-dependent DNA ligase [unclassified Rathayibacter]|uniref:DUF7882 family protein n=1 Tax=unclassified Rathayibacter TaxID=2609250 RepID=UPI000F97DB95|nr:MULTISPECIES: ATP-dependent DNA ligase [unclassified Rathayibacter]ROP48236.1 hypothetical protein EDF45_3382 [Rathayibacter sp. PhB186]ROS48578.1 hypothetical protein EDF44_3210 [Rathayibacter sp. PhB185]